MLFEYLKENYETNEIIGFVNEYLFENGVNRYEDIDYLEEYYGERAIDLVIALGKGGELRKDYFNYDGYGWIYFMYEDEVLDEMEKYYEDGLETAILDEDPIIKDYCIDYLDNNLSISDLKEDYLDYKSNN